MKMTTCKKCGTEILVDNNGEEVRYPPHECKHKITVLKWFAIVSKAMKNLGMNKLLGYILVFTYAMSVKIDFCPEGEDEGGPYIAYYQVKFNHIWYNPVSLLMFITLFFYNLIHKAVHIIFLLYSEIIRGLYAEVVIQDDEGKS